MTYFDILMFKILPYVAIAIFLLGTIYRYTNKGFQVSSLSSQFLEGKSLFWGSVPFHFGIIFTFIGHLIAFLIPNSLILWNGDPVRLIALEITGFIFGLSTLFGLCMLFYRRIMNSRVWAVTTKMDIFVELLLLSQVFLGCWIALGYRWGSTWFAVGLTPYLRSIFDFDPQIAAIVPLPMVVKLHIIGAFLLVLLFPFTRLVHILVAPVHYLFRPYQLVMWNWNRRKIRKPSTPWSDARPSNN